VPRLPEIFDRDALPEDQRPVHDYLMETRGLISPAFSQLLNHPEVAQRVAHLGTLIRFETSLPDHVRELAALAASTECEAKYEQAMHLRNARAAGVKETALDTVVNRRTLEGLTEEELIAVACARELTRDHKLTVASFEEARRRFGDKGVIELLATIGYYCMLACLHTGLDVLPPQ
jgi:4-carboxymuconolactone decarboxylase